MKKENLYLPIIILVAILVGGSLVYYSEKIKDLSAPESQTPQTYSYQDVMYNFWGFVTAKETDTLSVEGVIPDPENIAASQTPQTIKFKITANTKIVKLETVDKETKQLFVNQDAIQLNDHLGLKADEIDTEKKEAVATDILILEILPATPPLE